jgi:glucose/arabinose dehydrogenase
MKFFKLTLIAITAIAFTACNSGNGVIQNQKDTIAVTDSANPVALQQVTNVAHFPIETKSAPDSTHRLFVSDLSGKIFVLSNGIAMPAPFLDISSRLENRDSAPNIRGMYSMAFHPQFATNRKLYVCYNAPTKIDSNVCKMVVSEFTVSATNPNVVDVTTERRVFEAEGHTIQNDPGEITFGPDGYLYISVGDNGTPMNDRHAEEMNSYLGKLLRIDVSALPYKVPADNPFIGQKNVKPEIWAYGLRRFWRYSFDNLTHQLMGGDIGDKLEEEVDIITKGGNYGWPFVEGDTVRVRRDSVSLAGIIPPVITYRRNEGICAIGGSTYYGKAIPHLAGKYIFADFSGSIFSLTKNGQQWVRQRLAVQNKPESPLIINSFNIDENNEMYLSGTLNTKEGSKGVVYKIAPAKQG